MKKLICLAVSLLTLNLTPVFGQQTGAISVTTGQALDPTTLLPLPDKTLTKFNLDFPGGTPVQLVKAIEEVTGKPLNVIIPDEAADTKLPSLKMEKVDVVQLFDALGAASLKQENRIIGVNSNAYGLGNSYNTVNVSYGFRTDGNRSDDSIWYFYVQNPPRVPDFYKAVPVPVKACKFYSLAPYLNRGFTVDDITTAIQTGWKMLGDTSPPDISFHKETKLLIAVGEQDKMQVIDNVLKELAKSDYKFLTAVDPTTGLPILMANPAAVDPTTGLPLSTTKPNVEKSGK